MQVRNRAAHGIELRTEPTSRRSLCRRRLPLFAALLHYAFAVRAYRSPQLRSPRLSQIELPFASRPCYSEFADQTNPEGDSFADCDLSTLN